MENIPKGEDFWLIRKGFEIIPIIIACPRGGEHVDVIIRPITGQPIGLYKVIGNYISINNFSI